MTRLNTLIALAVVLAACGDAAATSSTAPPSTTTTTAVTATLNLADDDLVLTYEENGGCFMMGPNCRRFVLRADGSFDLYRAGDLRAEPVMTGSIDRSVASAVVAAVATTDFEALRAGLGPGVCNACVDGIDVIVVFHAAEGEPLFNSATVALDGAVFAAVADAVQAMGAASDLPIISR